jgi:Ca2+-binding RTX toxin-like protein
MRAGERPPTRAGTVSTNERIGVLSHLHHHRLRRGTFAVTVIIAMGVLNGPTAAHAAVNCVVSTGVTQTDTTVTGTSGNDTIDCGGANPGKTINGNAGNDTITGTGFVDTINGDPGNDTLTGGVGNDALNTCQGPGLDGDVLVACNP